MNPGAASAHAGRPRALVSLDRAALAELIDRKLELPSVPSMAMRVLHCVADERSSVQDLAKLIEADASLATMLLRLANSAFYGSSRFVSSVGQAVKLVGMQEVRNLAISVATRNLYKKTSAAERTLWAGAIGSAVAAHLLARRYAPEVREHAFLAGQLHDVGRVLMLNASPDAYLASERLAAQYGLTQAERSLYGFSHTDVGAVVMRRWQLPEMQELVAGSHHTFVPATSGALRAAKLNTCVIVADFLCFRAGIGAASSAHELDLVLEQALGALGIDKSKLDELQVAFNASVAEASRMFS